MLPTPKVGVTPAAFNRVFANCFERDASNPGGAQ
jgi:hypothetical protein